MQQMVVECIADGTAVYDVGKTQTSLTGINSA